MKQCMDADNLHRRLKKIIGQVQAIDRMVDEDVIFPPFVYILNHYGPNRNFIAFGTSNSCKYETSWI